MELIYRGQPDTQFAYLYRHWGTDLDMKHIVRRFILIIVILLLVPAINLSSMTLSRMRKRMTEIGVRKHSVLLPTNCCDRYSGRI